MGRRISDTLYWELMRAGMKPKTAGTVEASNEIAGRSRNGAARQFAAASRQGTAGGASSGVRLVWSNPAFRKTPERKRGAFLKVVR